VNNTSKGTYPFLPEEIFRDPEDVPAAPREATLVALDLYIRAKLALKGGVPHGCNSAELIDGVLILKKDNMFRLALTLAYPDKDAAWKPLNFRILLKCSSEGIPDRPVSCAALEMKVYFYITLCVS